MPEPIVIDQLTEHLTSIGSIHQTPAQLRHGYVGEGIVDTNNINNSCIICQEKFHFFCVI